MKKIVLVSDICLSTRFVFDLQERDRVQHWSAFLTAFANVIAPVLTKHRVEVYKFLGDGWIYLVPPDIKYLKFVALVRDMFSGFYRLFDHHITANLSFAPEIKGLTFGADLGELSRILVCGKTEFVGRALNVACRLQAAIKDAPPGKQILGHPYHNQVLLSIGLARRWNPHDIPGEVKVDQVRRTLRNIAGADYKDVPKLSFLGPFRNSRL